MIIGFVLYNEGSDFSERIRLVASLGCHIYIFDNSPESEYSRMFLNADAFTNISYFTAGSNIGLARAMSMLCAQAYYCGHRTLFFLDQDTHITNDALMFVIKLSNEFDFARYSALSISNCKVRKENDSLLDHQSVVNNVKLVRNSGTLFNLKCLSQLNWFDSSYFVDGVDYQFSLNSCLNGFSIGMIDNVSGFDHWSGQGYTEHVLFGISIVDREYPISRILDVTMSSLKLMFKSLTNWKFDYFAIFAKNLFVFLSFQLILRLSSEVKS